MDRAFETLDSLGFLLEIVDYFGESSLITSYSLILLLRAAADFVTVVTWGGRSFSSFTCNVLIVLELFETREALFPSSIFLTLISLKEL